MLARLKSMQAWLNQIPSDNIPKLLGHFLNKAKNELQEAICELEREQYDDMRDRFDRAQERMAPYASEPDRSQRYE